MMDRRRFAIAAGLFTLGGAIAPPIGSAALAASQSAPAIDPLSLVDPELRAAAEQIMRTTAAQGQQALTPALLQKTRTGFDTAFYRPPRPEVPTQIVRIPGLGGAPEVTLYVVNAKPGGARPGILHTHGGGFFLGSARMSVILLQAIAEPLDCTIVSVEYRLAPETTYKGSTEDNYAGLKWLHANSAELGVDPKRLAVMGESAGGGHAALLAINARDRGEVPLAYQMLIEPMLDDRTVTRPPAAHIGAIGWTRESNRIGWRYFLGQEPGGRNVPARAVPARTKSLAGLPPTFIGVGDIDLFAPEDLDYARRLMEAGVPVEFNLVPGAFHGFEHQPVRIARQFNQTMLAALRRGLKIPTADYRSTHADPQGFFRLVHGGDDEFGRLPRGGRSPIICAY